MADVLNRWSIANPGPGKLAVWLEPWAEEFEVSVRSVVTMEWTDDSDESVMGDFEWTADHLVVWANV